MKPFGKWLVLALALTACSGSSDPDPSGPSASPPPSRGSPSGVPASDIRLVLDDSYGVGSQVRVKIQNVGDAAYRYQMIYEACRLSYFDPSGRKFIIPPGTHCDIVMWSEIRPGETKFLFEWKLDECVRDAWGCAKSKPLALGTYTIRGRFPSLTGGTPAEVEATFEIVPSD